jgi:hypothetical protein
MGLIEELEREVMVVKDSLKPVEVKDFWGALLGQDKFDPADTLSSKEGVIDVKRAIRTLIYYREALEQAGKIIIKKEIL